MNHETRHWLRAYAAWIRQSPPPTIELAQLATGVLSAWIVPLSGIDD